VPRLPSGWAERTLAPLALRDARTLARAYQRETLTRRPQGWSPAPLPQVLRDRLDGPSASIGVFAPRADWDEPSAWASALAPLSRPDPVGVDSPSASPSSSASVTTSLRLAFPRTEADGSLGYRVCTPEQLTLNPASGVLEPPAELLPCTPALLLVPCLFADRAGRRIGRGRGYYDRYLSLHPEAFGIGVVHSDYFFESLPNAWFHEGDRDLAATLTESNFTLSTKEN
jgi:hypothetical protein